SQPGNARRKWRLRNSDHQHYGRLGIFAYAFRHAVLGNGRIARTKISALVISSAITGVAAVRPQAPPAGDSFSAVSRPRKFPLTYPLSHYALGPAAIDRRSSLDCVAA